MTASVADLINQSINQSIRNCLSSRATSRLIVFYTLYIFLIFSVHCHSLIVRLVSYLSCSQSPATFTVSSAYTASTVRPSLLRYPHTPQYLTAHLTPVSETASRQHLRSAASHQLTVPPHRRVTYGGRAFAVAGPSTWNSLPKRLRDPSHSTSVFRRLLKTFFFSEY